MDKKDNLSFAGTVENNVFAMKLASKYCRYLVVAAFFSTLFGYFEWVFFDGVFMRKIIEALDKDAPFQSVMTFILISGSLFFAINLYTKNADNVIFPLGIIKLYGGIYRQLFAKAKNVELKCYEDPSFYDKYTMAIDGAGWSLYRGIRSKEEEPPVSGSSFLPFSQDTWLCRLCSYNP